MTRRWLLPLIFVSWTLFSTMTPGAEPAACPRWHVIENSIGMKLVRIPAGEFRMGNDLSPDEMRKTYPQYGLDEKGEPRLDLPDERPSHRVRITKSFYLGQYEVTVGQFRKFVDAGYQPESVADGTGGYGYDPAREVIAGHGDAFAGRDPKYSWQNPGFAQGDDHPVTNVTWHDAQAMCEWLSAKEGQMYRLPTEAEWEYACRGGTTTYYSCGDDPEALIQVANLYDVDTLRNWPQWKPFALHGHDGYEFTSPVGTFAPNAFGLYDMHGNVWEWCADWYGEDYYAKSPVDDPRGPDEGHVRVRRGGSWQSWPLYVRSAYRNLNTESTRYTLVGMRLVREDDGAAGEACCQAASPSGRRGMWLRAACRPLRN